MLTSNYIKWLETFSAQYDFNKQYGELIKVIKETHHFKGKYHNTDHLIKTGYLAFLTATAFMRNNSAGMINPYHEYLSPELSSLVKAALLHDYCYLDNDDDSVNIQHTQNMVRTLAVEHSEVLSLEEAEVVNKLIAYTHYDFNRPEGILPQDSSEQIYFDILRDCDQLYACLYFDKDVFFALYEEIGKPLNFNVDSFLLRNINYVKNLSERLKTDFALRVYKEIIDELLEAHHALYNTFPHAEKD